MSQSEYDAFSVSTSSGREGIGDMEADSENTTSEAFETETPD